MAKDKNQNILDLIATDHRKVEQIFSQIESASNLEQLYRYFNQLYKEVNLHARAEELVFYPGLREYEDTDAMIAEAESEHEEAAALLEEIKALSPDSAEFKEKIAELKKAILHHVQEEESEVFETARDGMDEQQLKQLGQEFQEAKTKLEDEVVEAASL
ncbi:MULTISPECIES: hemerythrin domain-containing protein [Trichocoleus]|uniref:Hemerythrin domain-containing protein n=1 Tax=Trichocoleus desertorum GB2-A4 TaxID=2933944 RepID=A0ABV0J1P7_9CYAN|nr:hemerythrin domain-containing protein [Trichocoleus sp. FACHB-46]MBD1860313.1 hemerythrin domain-containing protein [Trichocoleus sp. FACHB-46]